MKVRSQGGFTFCFNRFGRLSIASLTALALLSPLNSHGEERKTINDLPVSTQEQMQSEVNQAREKLLRQKTLGIADPRQSAGFNDLFKDARELSGKVARNFEAKTPSGLPQNQVTAQAPSGNYDILIFISFGLDKNTLREIYASNADNKRVALILRGLVKGTKTIQESVAKIQEIATELKLKTPPAVLINPVWFRQYNINKVPAVVALNGVAPKRSGNPNTGKEVKGPDELARAYGLVDAMPLVREIENGKRGDLGNLGPVAEISERDLIDEMQERASKIDWEQKKREALAKAWDNQPIEELDKATENRLRVINPEFTVMRDITAADPKDNTKTLVIAKQGEKFNPLVARGFPYVVLITDPTDKREDEFVRNNLAKILKKRSLKPQNLMVVISNADRERGWDAYNELVREYNRHIWVLTPEMKARFMLERHPSLVWAEGLNFKVEEFGI